MSERPTTPPPRLEPNESIAPGLRRLALAELDGALTRLEDGSADPHWLVHETRKSIKRLRGLLRLVHDPLGASFSRLNRRLRSTARSLGPTREAVAARESLERLRAHSPEAPEARFAAALDERRCDTTSPLVVRALLINARFDLGHVRDLVAAWALADLGFGLVAAGFRRSYQRARRALAEAEKRRSPHAFHELRKAVKTHQYQIQYLVPLVPHLASRHDELGRLSAWLGEHHDLALLEVSLRLQGFEDLATLAAARMLSQEHDILELAQRLLQRKPRALTDSIRAYLEQ